MAYKILEQEAVDITHIDGAILNNHFAGGRSGIVGGYANECALASEGNTVIVSTGLLLLNGVRVEITEVESVVLSSTPTQDTTYQLIAQLTIDSNQAPSFEFIARTPQALIKNPIGQDGGVGVYQLELARFTHATDGTIKNIVRTANVLYGATNVDLNEIRASVQDARSQAQSAKQEAQAVYGLASNAVATSAAAQATAQEAKQIAQQAQEDVRGIEINVAEERGTVVTENGQPKAQVEWNDKLDKTPKEPKVVSDAFTSRITATNDVEIIDSPLNTKTATIKSIKGLSIKAIQKRGDFRTGALNDWSANAGYDLSIGNNILTVTINTDTPGQVVLTNNVQALPNRAYFIMCYVKTIAATSVQVGFSDGVKSVAKTTTANRWTYVSSKLSTNALSGPQIIVDCSSMTKGDSFQVRLFEVIDLEDSGIQDWTNEKLDATIPYLEYWEGVRHSAPAQLKSIGDNLFNLQGGEFTTQNSEYRLLDTGFIVETKSAGGTSSYINYWYELCPNTQYILRWEAETFGGSENVVIHWDSSNQERSYRSNQSTMTVDTDDTGTGRISFYSKTGTPDAIYKTKYENILLQHAVNPNTDYKPYTEHVLELPQYTLRSLPDGTADEITPTHYIQRINPETMTALEEPIYTPIGWDNTYPAWNYGLEQVFDADGNPTIAQMDIEYPLDIVKQVETNTEIIQQLEKQIQALLGD